MATQSKTGLDSSVANNKQAEEFFNQRLQFNLGAQDLCGALKNSEHEFHVVDVRATEDFEKEHIPGAINLPAEQWENLETLSKDKKNVVYCYSHACLLGTRAAAKFASAGYPVMEMVGGFDTWKKKEYPTEGRLSSTVQHTTETPLPLEQFKASAETRPH